MPNINDYLDEVKDIQKQDLGKHIATGEQVVSDIPQTVLDKTTPQLKTARDLLTTAERTVSDLAGNATEQINDGYDNNFGNSPTVDTIKDTLRGEVSSIFYSLGL